MPPDPSPDPTSRTVTVSFDLARLPGVGTALGVALLSAAIAVSAMLSREGDRLDGSTYTMGVLATLGLLGVAVGTHLLLPDAERDAALVSWPGAAGTVSAGLMLGILIDGDTAAMYGAGLLILGLAAIGYLTTRATPFVLVAILGLAVAYAQLVSDLVADDENGTNLTVLGAAVLVFVGGVTALGWLLPKTRVLTAVVVGVGAVAMMTTVFQMVVVFGEISTYSSETYAGFEVPSSSGDLTYDGSYEQLHGSAMDEEYEPDDEAFATTFTTSSYRDEIWATLGFSVALALFWALCALVTGHIAFRILSATILVTAIPACVMGLMVEYPTWWQVALTAVGALVLGAVGYRQARPVPPAQAIPQ